ncbi:MAG: hypothetical protein K2N23_02155 [Clostridia bacterium]|nr:hypothetical protein [Clostridia bacterium]
MKNIVVKAALITVGVLAAAGILVFSLWILISPQSMATVSEKLGNYSFAVTCADLKYKYSDDSYDLARCAEDSINYSANSKDKTGADKLIIKYCEPLIEKRDFDEVCRRKNEEFSRTKYGIYATDYSTYIRGNLAVAQYRAGDLDKAIKTAELGGKVDCFAKLVIAVVESRSEKDIEKLQTDSPYFAREYVKGIIELSTNQK